MSLKYIYSLNYTNNNVIIHIAVLICNSSAAVTPCNYEEVVTFYCFLKYQMFNLTNYMTQVILTVLVILNIAYPNVVW